MSLSLECTRNKDKVMPTCQFCEESKAEFVVHSNAHSADCHIMAFYCAECISIEWWYPCDRADFEIDAAYQNLTNTESNNAQA